VDPVTLVLFVVGLALLIVGAELLVRGASRLATAVGISPLVVGLTVVAFGTSSPELAVTSQASFAGQADLALGNVVGSNVFNVLFVLGLSALAAPLIVSQQLVRLDVPIMVGASVLLFLLALDGTIGRLDGLLLFAGIVAYTGFLVRQSRRESAAVKAEYEEAFGEPGDGAPASGGRLVVQVGFVAAGLALLVLGSRWLVEGAVAVATTLGVSELVIGLTIVAAGTSLPEVATSVLATVRGERDIAVGNVVGSSIYNVLAILGISGLVAPGGLPVAPSMLAFDIPVAIAVAVACLPIFFTGHLIARWEGALFLGYYAAYALYLILAATEHDALTAFGGVMLAFVLPLTAVTLAVLAVRSLRGGLPVGPLADR
jgi:cation:H+ antiporter